MFQNRCAVRSASRCSWLMGDIGCDNGTRQRLTRALDIQERRMAGLPVSEDDESFLMQMWPSGLQLDPNNYGGSRFWQNSWANFTRAK